MIVECMHVTGVDYGDYFAYIDFLREYHRISSLSDASVAAV